MTNNPKQNLDWNSVKGNVEDLLKSEVEAVADSSKLRAGELADLSDELALYWSLEQGGDPAAAAELAHLKARIALILARQDVEVRQRLESVLLQIVRIGAAFGKAVLLA